jgi:hypothetical protein
LRKFVFDISCFLHSTLRIQHHRSMGCLRRLAARELKEMSDREKHFFVRKMLWNVTWLRRGSTSNADAIKRQQRGERKKARSSASAARA